MPEETKPDKKSQLKRRAIIGLLLFIVLFVVFAIIRSLIIAIFIDGQI